ncbi:MAG: Lrp/AsnC ligand binding domain-containing protein [Candidatus Bathyarchaeia archaeon]|jgi:DNA-binding Lrp family transcriptional regulator
MVQSIIVVLNVVVQSQQLEKVTIALGKLTEVVDLFEVTGEYDLVAIIQTESIAEFRKLTHKILRIEGIKGTNSMIIIHTLKRNGKTIAE